MFKETSGLSKFTETAAKAMLADGKPHRYGEIVEYVRQQAVGSELEGHIEINNVWSVLQRMIKAPESPFKKVDRGIYQQFPPLSLEDKQITDLHGFLDQVIELQAKMEAFHEVQKNSLYTADEQDRIARICTQVTKELDMAIDGLSCWIAEMDDISMEHENSGIAVVPPML